MAPESGMLGDIEMNKLESGVGGMIAMEHRIL